MFTVESVIQEETLVRTMETMRTWLDHKHCEPATFRYTFTAAGILFRVDFPNALAATDFAKAFGGRMTPLSAETAI